MTNENFLDELYKGLGNAVDDIRTKLVEEPMWGRAVTAQEPEGSRWPDAKERAAQEVEAPEHSHQQTPDLER